MIYLLAAWALVALFVTVAHRRARMRRIDHRRMGRMIAWSGSIVRSRK